MTADKRYIHSLFRNAAAVSLLLLLISSCSKKTKIDSPFFQSLPASQTGLNFINQMKPTPEFNLFSYMYYYNGAGVGAADFNNDGLIDLFFSANQGDNKLFINKGSLKFEDVTAAAGIVQDSGWSTGVSVVDINNDGLLDIYVCKVGHYKTLHSKNQLLVCTGIGKDGIPVYKEEATEYGLDFSGFGTQAAFLDYDGDGDLDMFMLNHSVNHDGNYAPRENFLNTYDSLAGQKLYRNDLVKTSDGKTLHHFTNVTQPSGIHGSKIGYGLGVVVTDINLDGWPDLYVGNDFHENDYLYINQKNGTFVDETANCLMHTSEFSMGVDAADVTNDGYPEIISMDMLPYDPYMIRRSLAEDDYTIFQNKISYGYNYQYARNNLQWNRRNGMFSEVAQYAGVNATDWSWAPLWMDFDNDGLKDLFISNGIPKRMNDIDYINFVSNDEVQEKLRTNSMGEKEMALVNKFPEIKIPNQFFSNHGDFKFQNVTDSVQDNLPTFSNGSVYADFDNDGDLDLVVNNINDPVLLYENQTSLKKKPSSASIKLIGDAENKSAIGSQVVIFTGNSIRTYDNNPVHGFQSSMLLPIHIGLENTKVDSAYLIWPDRTCEKIELADGKQLSFTYKKGLPFFNYNLITAFYKNTSYPVQDITSATGLQYIHKENLVNEFNREPLIPHMNASEGPALAVADINHDGLDDVFMGSSKSFHNAVFIQQPGGKFIKKEEPALLKDSMVENTDAVWADVNNDTHPDLIIASGGNEYYGQDHHLQPLLYINDGKGNLIKKEDAFTDVYAVQSSIAANDFNHDGAVDLFIAGRVEPWNYGAFPRSFLLQNDGTGKFKDVTAAVAPELQNPGMITQAQWIDMDKDGNKDLVLCYEWGTVDAFIIQKNHFQKKTIISKNGWWNFVLPFDTDNDGDIDFVAGNFGLNSRLKASQQQPVSLYFNDFDGNERNEQLITYFLQGKEIPFATKQELEKQMPVLKKKFLYAEDFAKAKLTDLFGADKLKNAKKLSADYFSNAIFINKGNMQFEVSELPWQVQVSSFKSAAVINANGDNLPDILLMGNYYDYNVEIGRQDADFGSVLINKGNGRFAYEQLNGLAVKGQVRRIAPLMINHQQAYILARNNDELKVIRFN